MPQLEQFAALERDLIEKCFLHGDYCGGGALARANIKALKKEFGDLEDIAFTIEREAYGTVYVKFNWEIFEDKRERTSPEIERLHEVLSALIDYPSIDDELFSAQETEEEENAITEIVEYPGDLVRALKKRGWNEDAAEGIRDIAPEELTQLIYEALSRASESQGYDITEHEQQGAYIDCDKLAPHFLIERQWQVTP